MTTTQRALILGISGMLLVACTPEAQPDTTRSTPRVIKEQFFTARDTLDNVDSPAIWHSPDGQHWLLATAKSTNALLVFDAASGELLRRVGETGDGPGALARPNGVAVVDDLALVVERDNARVQVFSLPAFTSLGFIGSGILERPYGLAVYRDGSSVYQLYVTDNYETVDELVPADSLLDARVKHFSFTRDSAAVQANLVNSFGDVSGAGVLRVVESIGVDPVFERLVIAEEQEGDSHLKIYTLDGAFTGDLVAATYFPNQAEGIALYACADSTGYWIGTDQADEKSTFHLFDRKTFAHVSAFEGAETKNTDGIALAATGFGPFSSGVFYAVHDDGNVAAIDWQAVLDASGVQACSQP